MFFISSSESNMAAKFKMAAVDQPEFVTFDIIALVYNGSPHFGLIWERNHFFSKNHTETRYYTSNWLYLSESHIFTILTFDLE